METDSSIYEYSKPSYRSNFDIFSIEDTDISVQNGCYMVVEPINVTSQEFSPITFNFSSVDKYFDLSQSLLYVKVRVLQQSGQALGENDKVAPSNLFFHTMFSNAQIALGTTLIDDANSLHHYRSVLPMLISTSKAERDSFLTSILYYQDTKYEDFNESTNSGFQKRLKMAAGSSQFEMMGNLPFAIFKQTKYIVPGVPFTIRLFKNRPEFALECSTNTKDGVTGCPYKFVIDECQLKVKYISAYPEVVKKHQTLFHKGILAKYPTTKVQVTVSQIGITSPTHRTDQLIQGRLPTFVLFALVKSSSFLGTLNENGFNFKPFDLKSITLKADHPGFCYQTLKLDYDSGFYLEAFDMLQNAVSDKSSGIGIDRDGFKDGYAIYLFQLSPVPTTVNSLSPSVTGVLRAELEFKKAPSVPLHLISASYIQEVVEIDQLRNVTVS